MSSQKRTQRLDKASLPHAEDDDDREGPEAANAPGPTVATLDDMQLEVALYIESISSELRSMARKSELESLAYFLEMARIEASVQVERRALQLESSATGKAIIR